MSYDATRAMWAAIRAGAFSGPATALVAADIADRARADHDHELIVGVRALAADCGVGQASAVRCLRELGNLGALDTVAHGVGKRASRYRLDVAALRAATESLEVVDNLGIANRHESASANGHGALSAQGGALNAVSAPSEKQLPGTRIYQGANGGALDDSAPVDNPADAPGQTEARATALAQWSGALDGTEPVAPRPPDPPPPPTPAELRYAASLTPAADVASHVAGLRGALRGGAR